MKVALIIFMALSGIVSIIAVTIVILDIVRERKNAGKEKEAPSSEEKAP